MDDIAYKKSLKEVYVVLNSFTKEVTDRLPDDLKHYIINNMDDEYNFSIDLNKSLNEQNLMDKTRITLAKIYKNYLYNETELIELNKLRKLDNDKKRLKYNSDNIFENKEKIKKCDLDSEIIVVKHKENIIKRIINKIIKFF